MKRITVGDKAPVFSLPTDAGDDFDLAKTGKPVVLFFYPKDDTPGCTKEAIAFTDYIQVFEELGFLIIGMSPDPVKKHIKFRDKHDLKIPLVSDEDKTTLEAYGVWVEKSMYGKKYMGVERTTLIIDKTGKVLRAWHKVKVPGHVEEVLAAAREIADNFQ